MANKNANSDAVEVTTENPWPQLSTLFQFELYAVSDVARFTSAEVKLLKHYVGVMRPFCQALDILQGVDAISMGYLLPTLALLREKLLARRSKFELCDVLADHLIDGIDRRFDSCFNSQEVIAAALLHPSFRGDWPITDAQLLAGKAFIKANMDDVACSDGDADSDDEGQFFSALPTQRHTSKDAVLTSWLAEGKSALGSSSFEKHHSLLALFLETNTPLPSSASAERLFSTAGLIFQPRRIRMTDTNFENQLLVNLNSRWLPVAL